MFQLYILYLCVEICTEDEYTCPNGKCIPESWRCDYFDDCGDNGDEIDGCVCDLRRDFECTAGGCIKNSWVCDGEADCVDGSDETVDLCGPPTRAPGKLTKFQVIFLVRSMGMKSSAL